MLKRTSTKGKDASEGKSDNFEVKMGHDGERISGGVNAEDTSLDGDEQLAHKTSKKAENTIRLQTLMKRLDGVVLKKAKQRARESEIILNQTEGQMKVENYHLKPTFSPVCVRNKGLIGNK